MQGRLSTIQSQGSLESDGNHYTTISKMPYVNYAIKCFKELDAQKTRLEINTELSNLTNCMNKLAQNGTLNSTFNVPQHLQIDTRKNRGNQSGGLGM